MEIDSTPTGSFVTQTKPYSFVHDIYITGTIHKTDDFIDAVDLLNSCSPNDLVNVYINTDGGSADAAMFLYNALQTCKAYTIAHCSGTVASAGTIIMMGCEKLMVAKHTGFMFHNVSFGTYGNVSDVKSYTDFTAKQSERMLRDIYEDFFTDEEYKTRLLNRDNIWMTDTEVVGRYNKMSKVVNSEDDEPSFTEQELKKLTKDQLVKFITGEIGYDLETRTFG